MGRAPLLGAAVGIETPDNELTTALDAKVRKATLEDLLATQYDWRTPKTAGSCCRFELKLADGVTWTANFQFK